MWVRRLAYGILACICVLPGGAPAHGDTGNGCGQPSPMHRWDRQPWQARPWHMQRSREHEWHEHEWWAHQGYFGPPVYALPPVYGTYAPPPPAYFGSSPGTFSLRLP